MFFWVIIADFGVVCGLFWVFLRVFEFLYEFAPRFSRFCGVLVVFRVIHGVFSGSFSEWLFGCSGVHLDDSTR